MRIHQMDTEWDDNVPQGHRQVAYAEALQDLLIYSLNTSGGVLDSGQLETGQHDIDNTGVECCDLYFTTHIRGPSERYGPHYDLVVTIRRQ